MSAYDIDYVRACPTPVLRNGLAWRRDFLANPGDFPATPGTRDLWARQARMIERELRRRGVQP